MIRLSSGTASSIGLNNSRMDAYPTTAYLLSGSRCPMKCAFCPQGSGDLNRLGRINWPAFSWGEVERGFGEAEKKGIRRICLQSVRHEAGILPLLEIIEKIKTVSALPLSLSAWIRDLDEAGRLFAAGVERISISLDAANPEIYKRVKGGSFTGRLDLLLDCARVNPGRMSTHLICGLGESELELLSLAYMLLQAKITVALFAFFPLKGTMLEGTRPPAVDVYRRVQAAVYLLLSGAAKLSSFSFEKGRLQSFGLSKRELKKLLRSGEAFQTGGCPGCNRPYYNERPGKTIYNYPRRMNAAEKEAAFKELFDSLQF